MSKISQHSVALLHHYKLCDSLARKEVTTTKIGSNEHSSPETLEWSSQQDSSHKSQKTKQLQVRIHSVKMAQEVLEKKFEEVLQQLTSQITKKDEANIQLRKEIDLLRYFLRESTQDLKIITNYLKKQQQRDSCKQNSRNTLNLNETLNKDSRFAARKQIFPDITVESMVTPCKSISPRMKLLKKTIKG